MKVHVIYGGQFGSESKRLFTEFYCHKWKPGAIITNAMPNSGGFDSDGVKWSTLPIGYPATLMISPGSVIDLDHLKKEIAQLPEGARVVIHQHAAVVQEQHFNTEKDFVRVGSTMTGGAAATIDKMGRNPENINILAKHAIEGTVDNAQWVREMHSHEKVLAICAQGHSLSLNFGFWPYCTSRNTSPAQVIADAAISPLRVERIIGCFRTFPIRVSNRFDEKGHMIGFSGPCYSDQEELTWGQIGVPAELTSVSKKVRRVFSFSVNQLMESIQMNGTTDVFLGFINYLPAGLEQEDFIDLVKISAWSCGASLSWIGCGKTIKEIVPADSYERNVSWVD
ncbi:MAG: adenylosuccinate synthetase [Methanoregula sp.]|jgi:adenylosuccinate synthase